MAGSAGSAGSSQSTVVRDVVIGRRATNLAARWLRTGDLIVLAWGAGTIDATVARRAIDAQLSAGRITAQLRDDFVEAHQMSNTVRIIATMDAELLARIDAYAAERDEDRSTALRQLADFALREHALRDALEAYRQGRVSLREFAAALAVDVWRAHDLLRAHRVAVAQGDRDGSRAGLVAMHEELEASGA